MPALVAPAAVTTGMAAQTAPVRAKLKTAAQTYGPAAVPNIYPKVNGEPKTDLTNAEVIVVWTAMINRHAFELMRAANVDAAADTARVAALADNATDPFA